MLLLGGLAFLLQGDVQTHPPTQEEIASQQLGGALFVAGAGLTLGAGVAGLGTQAATAACADGDCTNEVRSAGQVVQDAVQQTPPQTVKQTAYEIAKAGGRHSGMLRNYAARSLAEVQRGINSLQKASQLHAEKIANPAKYIEDWSAKTPEEQQQIIDFWHKEMLNYQQQAEVLTGLFQDALGGQ